MTGRAKLVIAATMLLVALVISAVVVAVFNPTTSLDARFGRGKAVTELAEQIAVGGCDEVPLRRSGNKNSWLSTCAELADLIDEDAARSIIDRYQTTIEDPLGLANSTDFTYSFGVTDTLERTRKLTIVVNEDNKLVEAGIDQILLAPGDGRGYANRHRYNESYGYTQVDGVNGMARPVTELVLSATSEPDCRQRFSDMPSAHLLDTVNEADFIDLCLQLIQETIGAELNYGEVRLMEPSGRGPLIAATDVTVVDDGVETLLISVGLELEAGQWRLRSLFAEEKRLFYRG